MNDFLEKLEIGENKVKLSKEEIKAIMAEHGKTVKTETEKVQNKYEKDINEYKTTINDLKEQVEKAPKSDEIENLKTKIADYEQKEADRVAKEKAEEEDKILINNIEEVFGDKKFINDYTKNSIMNEIKEGLKDKNNVGKSASDLFNSIIKDRTDIFANPNTMKDMPGMGDITNPNLDKPVNNEIKLNPMFKNYN